MKKFDSRALQQIARAQRADTERRRRAANVRAMHHVARRTEVQ